MRLLLITMFLLCGVLRAQQTISEAAARANLLTASEPLYPPIAKAAQVSGDVIVAVTIDVDGTVASTKVLSGPAMLRSSALQTVKQWHFKPYVVGGVATAVTTTLTLTFRLANPPSGDEQRIAAVYFPLSDKCHALVQAHGDTAEQAKTCLEAAKEAEKFDQNTRFIERRSAYVYCTTALIRNKDVKQALVYGNKAVEVVKQGHDDGSGSSASYGVRAQAEAVSGNLVGADGDLTVAENDQRAALAGPAGKSLNAEYTRVLKSLLTFHAQVLTGMGRADEANKLTAEASRL